MKTRADMVMIISEFTDMIAEKTGTIERTQQDISSLKDELLVVIENYRGEGNGTDFDKSIGAIKT